MTDPLWSNERIVQEAAKGPPPTPRHAVVTRAYCIGLCAEIRNDYEAHLESQKRELYAAFLEGATMDIGLKALMQKHHDELEVEMAAHRDALTLCAAYEATIATQAALIEQLTQGLAEAKKQLIARPDWKMPDKPVDKCTICEGHDIVPIAYDTGEGWLLEWACKLCGSGTLEETTADKAYIDWPFHENKSASANELRLLGFDVV